MTSRVSTCGRAACKERSTTGSITPSRTLRGGGISQTGVNEHSAHLLAEFHDKDIKSLTKADQPECVCGARASAPLAAGGRGIELSRRRENAESWVTATREWLPTRKRCREQGRCHILGAPGMRVSNSGPGFLLALWGESRKLLQLYADEKRCAACNRPQCGIDEICAACQRLPWLPCTVFASVRIDRL